MKTTHSKIIIYSLVLLSFFSCNKNGFEQIVPKENAELQVADSAASAVDQVSYAASQNIPNKKFVKTADVKMEVKDVYDATVFIEKQLKDFGGFVTLSQLNSNVLSEETYETSDTEATLVKKFQTENTMQVRVPTEKLADFLTVINDKKLFLNSRIILAEDVSANAKIAELETKKLQKTADVISKMKNNIDQVEKTEDNLDQTNQKDIANIILADQLKYATLDIYIKEPKIRVAEIAVLNSKNIDNKYKFNFFYDAKNAFVEGFYLIQRLIVGLIAIWPAILIGVIIVFFIRKRKPVLQPTDTDAKN